MAFPLAFVYQSRLDGEDGGVNMGLFISALITLPKTCLEVQVFDIELCEMIQADALRRYHVLGC